MRAVVLVPRRADGGHRDALWEWCRDVWWADLGLPIEEGFHDVGPFNRSAAVNVAAVIADYPRWDVAVVLDADTLIHHNAVRSAVTLAHASGQVTWGFERWAGVSEAGTEQILSGYRGDWEQFVGLTYIGSASSCLAIPRPLWDRIGGMDEGFVGWGWEDVALSLALQAIGGGSHRIAGTAWHLHHAPAEGTGNSESPIWQANQSRCARYLDAGTDPDKMETVLRDYGLWERFG